VSEAERELLQAVIDATVTVSRVLDDLSMESLTGWKAKYHTEPAPSPPRARSNDIASAKAVTSSETRDPRKKAMRQA
jgi:hypothetical protein